MHALLSATQKFTQIIDAVDKPVSLIKEEIRKLSNLDEGVDEFFLYFTGHGLQNSDDFYMCFKEFDESSPNTTGLSRTEA